MPSPCRASSDFLLLRCSYIVQLMHSTRVQKLRERAFLPAKGNQYLANGLFSGPKLTRPDQESQRIPQGNERHFLPEAPLLHSPATNEPSDRYAEHKIVSQIMRLQQRLRVRQNCGERHGDPT